MNYIYRIANTITNKVYIGQTTNTQVRWRKHKWHAASGSSVLPKLYPSMRKYGVDNFMFEVIDIGIPDDKINLFEKIWISFYNSFENGYNSTLGGESPWNKGKTGIFSESDLKRRSNMWVGDNNPCIKNKKVGTEAHRSNFNYVLISPSGEKFQTGCLAEFCRVHDLDKNHLNAVLKGTRNHHKGWKMIEKTLKST